MFFKSKKATPDLLVKENIITNCVAQKKDDVIRKIGSMLVKGGYVKENYIDAMLERELTFSTNMGNGIALPHGVERAKEEILNSGIAVMTFPNGTDWNGEQVKIVVGIAGKGDEHLDILANIAEKLGDEEEVEKVVNMDANGVYNVLMRKGA